MTMFEDNRLMHLADGLKAVAMETLFVCHGFFCNLISLRVSMLQVGVNESRLNNNNKKKYSSFFSFFLRHVIKGLFCFSFIK